MPDRGAMLGGPVHLISGAASAHGGISRYCRELYKHLQGLASVQVCTFQLPLFAKQLTFLEHMPVGVHPDGGGGVYHFTRIMGSSLMLWRPVRPAVATVHDLGPLVWPAESNGSNLLGRFLFRLSLLGLKRMDRIIADSLATGQALEKYLHVPPERIAVIHLGVDLAAFRRVPGAREKLAHKHSIEDRGSVYNVLYVGSEAPRKNMSTLLQVLSMLRLAGTTVRLIKVGPPGHPYYRANFLKEVQSLGLEGQVVVVDDVPDADLPTFYSAADVFVLPSFVEGFGLPVLESMACGTPVVCSHAGSLPEVAGDAALLVDPQDVHSQAKAIDAVLADHNLRQDLAAKGLERCRQFTWEQTARQTMAVYADVQ